MLTYNNKLKASGGSNSNNGFQLLLGTFFNTIVKDLRKLIKYEEKLSINTNQNDYFESLFKRTTASYRAKVDKENAQRDHQIIDNGWKKRDHNAGQEAQLYQCSSERLPSDDKNGKQKVYLRTVTNMTLAPKTPVQARDYNEKVGVKDASKAKNYDLYGFQDHQRGNVHVKKTRGSYDSHERSWQSLAQKIGSSTEVIKRLPRQDLNRQGQWQAEQAELKFRHYRTKAQESDSDIRQSSYSLESLASTYSQDNRIGKASKQDFKKSAQRREPPKQVSEKKISLDRNENYIEEAPNKLSKSSLNPKTHWVPKGANAKSVNEFHAANVVHPKQSRHISAQKHVENNDIDEPRKRALARSNAKHLANDGVGVMDYAAEKSTKTRGTLAQRHDPLDPVEKVRVAAPEKREAYSQDNLRNSQSPPTSNLALRSDHGVAMGRNINRSKGRNRSENVAKGGGIGEEGRDISAHFDSNSSSRRSRTKERKKPGPLVHSRTRTRSRQRKPMSSDPVALYQYYQREWRRFRKLIPGENSHSNLRRTIRAKLLASPH